MMIPPVQLSKDTAGMPHEVFGLAIAADVPLGHPGDRTAETDVRIVAGDVPPESPAGWTRIKPCIARTPDRLWYRLPGLLRAQTDHQGNICWQAEKDLPGELVVELLMDAVLPDVLQRRGFLVRRGFAFGNDRRSVLVIGTTHTMRSGLWPGLAEAGLTIFSDGLCVARQDAAGLWQLYPGVPRSLHWDIGKDGLPPNARRLRADVAVYRDETPEHFASTCAPLGAVIFTADTADGETPHLVPIKGEQRLEVMDRGVCFLHPEDDRSARAQRFRSWMQLAAGVPFHRLHRPREETRPGLTTLFRELLS